MRSITCSVAAAVLVGGGMLATVAAATPASARSLNTDSRIGARLLEPICDGEVTIYQVRLRNATGRSRSFYHDAGGTGLLSRYARGWTDIAGHTSVVDEYRVQPGESWSIVVRYRDAEGYVLARKQDAGDVCATSEPQEPLPLPVLTGLGAARQR